MTIDESDHSVARKKLIGWKMISRHFGRSERAIQLWEGARGLPIHRIPGGPGHTVYAYAEQLDAWMESRIGLPHASTARAADVGPPAEARSRCVSPARYARPPGILVLPFENRSEPMVVGRCDALAEQTIVRLAAVQQSVRVLSWTTARRMRGTLDPLDSIASRLSVRYVVEGTIETHDHATRLDVRIVDAERDELLLADRLVLPEESSAVTDAHVAETVALHFALLHRGALVEPMCLGDVAPHAMLDYLHGAWYFETDHPEASERALLALDRALQRAPTFACARALRALVLLQSAACHDPVCCEEARTVACSCAGESSTRVTLPFLEAALAVVGHVDADAADRYLANALRSLSPGVVGRGRLYDRRSPLHPRAGEQARTSRAGEATHLAECHRTPRASFVAELLQTLAARQGRGAVVAAGTRPAQAWSEAQSR